jgi:DNA-binding NarL/FixJ family response regulator
LDSDSRSTRAEHAARAVVIDDHPIARAGLRGVLASVRGVQVVGEAATGREAVELCRRLSPQLVLMDVRMPDMDGLTATRAIKQTHPSTSVIIMTMHENPDYLFEALKAGAAGYLLKDASEAELVGAIRRVLAGESLLTTELMLALLQRLAGERKRFFQPPLDQLTTREREVLLLLTQGQTNRQIAQTLTITSGTAKMHVEHVIAKLGVSDRTQAAVRGIQLGLLASSAQ